VLVVKLEKNSKKAKDFIQMSFWLKKKLGISKARELWTSLGYGKRDYLQLRKKLFKKETIESLYRKIKKLEGK
jgi:hypothetical protein